MVSDVLSTTAAEFVAEADRLRPNSDAFISGAWCSAKSGKRFTDRSPHDGRILAEVAACDVEDVDVAVSSARSAFDDGRWSRRSAADRRKVLQRLARLIEAHRLEFALIESLDVGKPISDALNVDLQICIDTMDYYAEATDKIYDQIAPTDQHSLGLITREPLGVVGAVVPWNFPLMLAIWKIAPALATGNSIVVKPAEQSSLSVLKLAELACEAGVPEGVLNVVPGFGPTAGAALGLHSDVDGLTFTGSSEVGRMFMHYSADSNMKQVSLECGGRVPRSFLPTLLTSKSLSKPSNEGFLQSG